MNVEGVFYSFQIDEIPRLRHLKELLFSDSVVPPELDPAVLPIYEERHVRGRKRLDEIPRLEEVLAEEEEIYRAKKSEIHLPGQPYVIRYTYVRRLDFKRRLRQFRAEVKAAARAKLTGDFIYYPGSYREWHTNLFDRPGWRMYMVDVAEEGRSGFRYLSPSTGEIVSVPDRRGKVNFFLINSDRPLLHCVYSETRRWSKGFLIPDGWQERLFR
jgi:hypothetical protein